MTSKQQLCLNQMREIYAEFSGEEIAYAIKVIRAEMTAEEDRHELQKEILLQQKKLEELQMAK